MSHHGMAVKNHNIPHVMHASCTSIPFATQKYYMRYIRTIPIPGLERARVARVLAEYPYRLYIDYMHGPGVDFISSSSPLSLQNRYASRLCIYYTSLWHPEYCYDENICLLHMHVASWSAGHLTDTTSPSRAVDYICTYTCYWHFRLFIVYMFLLI